MKNAFRLALALLAVSLTSCLFKEAIFTTGFVKVDPTLSGVWMAEGENKDPREREFAVLAAIGEDAYMLHYPVDQKGGHYFEARPLKVNDKDLWQVRHAVSFDDGLPKSDTPTYTLVWIEKAGENQFSVRSLNSDGPHTASVADTRKALEDKAGDWNKLFGEKQTFVRLQDK
jgi:hypothetical protein